MLLRRREKRLALATVAGAAHGSREECRRGVPAMQRCCDRADEEVGGVEEGRVPDEVAAPVRRIRAIAKLQHAHGGPVGAPADDGKQREAGAATAALDGADRDSHDWVQQHTKEQRGHVPVRGTCMHSPVHARARACACKRMCVHVHVHMYMHMCMCMCMCMYMCT